MKGIELITKEREEQIFKHGFDPYHDDQYVGEELQQAASAILTQDWTSWPENWDVSWRDRIHSKPRIEQLTIAGALIAAEIDRIDRLWAEEVNN